MHKLINFESVRVDPPGPVDDVIPEVGQVRVINFYPILCKVGVTNQTAIPVKEKKESRDFSLIFPQFLDIACLEMPKTCHDLEPVFIALRNKSGVNEQFEDVYCYFISSIFMPVLGLSAIIIYHTDF
jgi:hypothetical protein